ncbi:hypothetical protein HOLleu_02330 [Holothuria leucospilota]|uniref:Uncharacterized protein n=1 Tax=Holothuria leucospilota TaxID=206669 RepID=A0A9Q1HKT6_HOLLE|nr:hypothetical protein HOLleu_02330 [Holothuria leucospilota]
MAFVCAIRWFLVSVLISSAAKVLHGKTLLDVRQFHVVSKAGLFSAPRSSLEVELAKIKMQDAVCGSDINLDLPHLTDDPDFAELFISMFTIADHTLNEELTCDMKEKVAVNYVYVTVALPILSGKHHGLIFLAHFTDAKKQTIFPFGTNYERVNRIDSIEELEDGTIILSRGDDVMIMNVYHNVTCEPDQWEKTRHDFDEATAKLFLASDYPVQFDWGCNLLGHDVSFCKDLQENECGLSRAGPDVCIELTTSKSKRCEMNMQISTMTGFFQDAIPYLSAPVYNIEGTWVDREHGTNIVFPCFTSNM